MARRRRSLTGQLHRAARLSDAVTSVASGNARRVADRAKQFAAQRELGPDNLWTALGASKPAESAVFLPLDRVEPTADPSGTTPASPWTLTPEAARVLTEEVRVDSTLWATLLRLYEGAAHIVLGYSSWGAYYAAELGGSGSNGYRHLKSAEVMKRLSIGDLSSPRSQAIARELVSVFGTDPDRLEEVWVEVVEEHGPEPTAAQVHEAVLATSDELPKALLRSRKKVHESLSEIVAFLDVLGEYASWSPPPGREYLGWPKDQVQRALPYIADDELDTWINQVGSGVRAANALGRELKALRRQRASVVADD